MRRTRLFGCIAATFFCALAADAHAVIQIDHGIAGVRLGNSRAEVRAALGRPSAVTTGDAGGIQWVRYLYRAEKLEVLFEGRTMVSTVSTWGAGDRTVSGVGVGSTQAAVASAVPGVTCGDFAGGRECRTGGRLVSGQRYTVFRFVAGKVETVLVRRVIDK